eukprot:TRINITY_DN29259_c0_g1_i1.p1 TRINITY_DN29259_c0_g1~~TRINITY_DN29259_c0_g1_i1.p1  ORF type:complete len:366 (-),score=43.42 TRINITY_DN29259_c0_g1_i1:108-1205(-)
MRGRHCAFLQHDSAVRGPHPVLTRSRDIVAPRRRCPQSLCQMGSTCKRGYRCCSGRVSHAGSDSSWSDGESHAKWLAAAGGNARQYRLELRLWAAWKQIVGPRPIAKEIKECLAFYRETRNLFGRKRLVVDAAGGHGALALAFTAGRSAESAIVADMYTPSSFESMHAAWIPSPLPSPLEDDGPTLQTRANVKREEVDLRNVEWLQTLLMRVDVSPSDCAVVACHACGPLADEIIRTCLDARVNFAVMPCCHGERGGRGDNVKRVAQTLGVPREVTYDLMRVGAIDATPGYVARLRTIDPEITPVNRIVVGLLASNKEIHRMSSSRDEALDRIFSAYEHRNWRRVGVGKDNASVLAHTAHSPTTT